MMPLVVARRICREFETRDAARTMALRDVDCIVPEGARIALVGASGSGKSTLLHILAGMDNPTAGRIEWPALGSASDLRPQKVGLVFQAPSLLPSLTALQNVTLPSLLAGVDGEDPLDLLGAFGLREIADKLPEELSSGQAQRVAMARALAIRPPLVLADEPTGFLDGVTAQAALDALIVRLDAAGGSLVLATHDEAVAARMNTRWTIVHGSLTCEELP